MNKKNPMSSTDAVLPVLQSLQPVQSNPGFPEEPSHDANRKYDVAYAVNTS